MTIASGVLRPTTPERPHRDCAKSPGVALPSVAGSPVPFGLFEIAASLITRTRPGSGLVMEDA
ncbi:MAG: hypothetical protein HZA68_00685 [Rhodovulum sp.]|nr:hypothetical protein [Rhodovulum sp.]